MAAFYDRLMNLKESTKKRLHCHCHLCNTAIDTFCKSALAEFNIFLSDEHSDHSYSKNPCLEPEDVDEKQKKKKKKKDQDRWLAEKHWSAQDEQMLQMGDDYFEIVSDDEEVLPPASSLREAFQDQTENDENQTANTVQGNDQILISTPDSSVSPAAQTLPSQKRKSQHYFSSSSKRPKLTTTITTKMIQKPKTKAEYNSKIKVINLRCFIDNCAEVCATKDHLNDHIERKHKIWRHRCLIRGCGKSFPSQDQIRTHRNTEHANLTAFICARCPSKSKNYSNLASHDSDVHELGTFRCGFNNCSFESTTVRRVLQTHFSSHRLTICPVCEKIYRNGYLAEHLRSHRNERPWVCEYTGCGKAFTNKCNLTTHERSHTGEKPFPCAECGYPFIQKCDLVRHMKNKHPEVWAKMNELKMKPKKVVNLGLQVVELN